MTACAANLCMSAFLVNSFIGLLFGCCREDCEVPLCTGRWAWWVFDYGLLRFNVLRLLLSRPSNNNEARKRLRRASRQCERRKKSPSKLINISQSRGCFFATFRFSCCQNKITLYVQRLLMNQTLTQRPSCTLERKQKNNNRRQRFAGINSHEHFRNWIASWQPWQLSAISPRS